MDNLPTDFYYPFFIDSRIKVFNMKLSHSKFFDTILNLIYYILGASCTPNPAHEQRSDAEFALRRTASRGKQRKIAFFDWCVRIIQCPIILDRKHFPRWERKQI